MKDSKLLSDTTVDNKASQIRQVCGPKRFRIVIIPSLRYNILILEMKNVNRLLGWAHARAIEDLLANCEGCSLAVADQFGDPAYIRDSLMARGRQIELLQTPKAERDVAVAAASILARDTFLRMRDELSRAYVMYEHDLTFTSGRAELTISANGTKPFTLRGPKLTPCRRALHGLKIRSPSPLGARW